MSNFTPDKVPNVSRIALCDCSHGVTRHRSTNGVVERLTWNGHKYLEHVWSREECQDCECQHYRHKEFKKL